MINSASIIKTSNLSRDFGPLRAVNALNLEIARGEIFGLLGPDGAGKTTTLRLLCGLLDPTEGEVWVAGCNVSETPDTVRDNLGYMAQRFGLYGDLTVEENINFYADLFGIPKRERADALKGLLRMTRMEPFKGRQARRLSGGMKQKLALMCTLLHRPKLLLLDEPTNGVDPVSRRDFWAILYQLVKEGMTILLTTAYMDEAERCNRIGMMYKGRLILNDAPEVIKDHLSESCLEVACNDLRLAKEVLEETNGVLSAEPAGAALHIFSLPEVCPPARVNKVLSEKGFKDIEVRQIIPSLEDIFIGVIAKVSKGNG